jgi:hypothetical protein
MNLMLEVVLVLNIVHHRVNYTISTTKKLKGPFLSRYTVMKISALVGGVGSQLVENALGVLVVATKTGVIPKPTGTTPFKIPL